MFELWGLFLATAALGAVCGYMLRSMMSQKSASKTQPKNSSGNDNSTTGNKVEGKVIKTTPDMLAASSNRGDSYPVEQIEGVGKIYAKKLRSIGVRQTHDLLDLCRDAEGRDRLAKYLKVSSKEVSRWTSMADLMRVSGIGGQFAELLEAANVSTIEDLMNQKGDQLAQRLNEINNKKNMARNVPDSSRVGEWVKQASKMESYVTLN